MESTHRLTFVEPVPLERSPEGEERERETYHTVYGRLARAPAGRETEEAATLGGEWVLYYDIRREAHPKNVDESWSVINEDGQSFDIESIQPLPARSSFRRFKIARRRS